MPSRVPRGFFAAAAAVGDKVVAAGEDGSAELYDPDADTWGQVKSRRSAVAKYDAAVVQGRMFVTEGWTWPFEAPPRGAVYDVERDEWGEMAKGMREGWTGSSAVVVGTVYIVAEYGEGRVKRYEEKGDEWRVVAGGGVPPEVRRPYAVAGEGLGFNNGESGGNRSIFVVGEGLDVAVGTLVKEADYDDERIEWQVIKGPAAFHGFKPCSAQMLYL